MKNKKLKLMAGAFIFIFVAVTLMWQIPKAFATASLSNVGFLAVMAEDQIFTGPWRNAGNPITLTACDATKFHVDVNDGGVNPLTPTSCTISGDNILLTFANAPWYHLARDAAGYAEANGLYLDAGAVTDSLGDTNLVVAHDASAYIQDLRPPWMDVATRNSDTQIVVTFTDMLEGVNDPSGFIVADANDPLTVYANSIFSWDGGTTITLTAADISASAVNGLKITYDEDVGSLVKRMTLVGAQVETDLIGVTIASWAPPAMSSVVADSNTQLTVTLSKVAASDTITKSNDGGFVVTETGGTDTYAVTAIAPGATNAKVVLTVANMSASATTGVTVTYAASGNGTVADANSIAMATDAVGVVAAEWTPPTISSAVKDSNTQITVTLSEHADTDTITKSNDGGFVVTQTGTLTTFAVSAVAPGETNDKVVLTVADMTDAQSAGVTVTYVKSSAMPGGGRNGTVTDANGNAMATDSTGVSIAAWFVGRRSSTTTTTTTSDSTGTAPVVVIPEPTVTVPYGQTAPTTVSETGTTAAMSFGSAVSFPVNGASVSVSVSNLASPSAGTASVVIEVSGLSPAKLASQKLRAQGLKLDLDLKVGEPQKVDVDGDGIMDLEINLEEVVSITDVKITIKKLEKASVEQPKAVIDYTVGKWVKVLNNPIVYFVDTNNVRHIYLTQTIWESYFGKDFSRVMIVPVEEMLNYALGDSVPFKAGMLIKTPNSPKVYKVDTDGSLQWILNEETANKIVGANWAKMIVDVAEVVLAQFKLGLNLE